MPKERNYGTPCCPACQEECHVCCHEKMYVDANGEWQMETEEK